MKKNLTAFLFALLFLFVTFPALSQGPRGDHDLYSSALGVRLGVYPGISYKQFISPVSAFELLVQTKFEGVIGTVLYEAHFQALRARRLHWILGFGGHVANYPAGKLENPDGEVYDEDVRTIGIDGIFGIEYVFQTAPLTLGFDVKPFFDLVNPGPNFFDTAVTIRYRF
jgi:Zn-dependent M28 family amino/carboxypeptidase